MFRAMWQDHDSNPEQLALQQPIIADGEVVVTDDVEVLKKVAGALYAEGATGTKIDEWFCSSAKLAASVSEWLLADVDKRSALESAVLQVLLSAEAAAASTAHIACDQFTAADVAVAAAAAGFYFCVRSCALMHSKVFMTAVGRCSELVPDTYAGIHI
jgi:hypothetical protein